MAIEKETGERDRWERDPLSEQRERAEPESKRMRKKES